MKNILIFVTVLLAFAAANVRGDLFECDDKKLPTLADISEIGQKVVSQESSAEHDVAEFFKNIGCHIKKGARKVKEQAKKLGVELKAKAKELGAKAKDFSSDFKVKFNEFKNKLAQDSVEDRTPHELLANVEIINPDILKAEQHCGHGHILDALGNCHKLRK